jgi:phosphatidylglycerophosphatase A
MKRLNLFIGSIAFTGLFPIMPATVSTFALALLFWVWGPGPLAMLILLLVSLVVSVPVATRLERDHGKDPRVCTIDELVGFAATLQGRDLSAPGAWQVLLLGFLLFRFFDIVKVWPANALEGLPAGWGIVADDLMAGIYSLASLWLLMRYVPWLQ